LKPCSFATDKLGLYFLACLQQEGHSNDWIYGGGPYPGPIKGGASHYYNEFRWDSDPETGGDFVAGENVPEDDLDNYNFVANERVCSSPMK
jgi:hypothetical protein